MGGINRPTFGWSHGLRHGGELVAVVATDTLIRERVAGLRRCDAVELSRLCAARPELSRVVLRLWRVFVFSVLAHERGFRWAVSYQDTALHRGDIYRFDGWVRIGRRKIIWDWCGRSWCRHRRCAIAFPVADLHV